MKKKTGIVIAAGAAIGLVYYLRRKADAVWPEPPEPTEPTEPPEPPEPPEPTVEGYGYIYKINYLVEGRGWRDLWNVVEGQLEIPTVELGKGDSISVWFYCKNPSEQVRSTVTRPDGTQKIRTTNYYPPGGKPATGEWDWRGNGSGGISPLDQIGTYMAKYELLGVPDKESYERPVIYTVNLPLIRVVEPVTAAFELSNFSAPDVYDPGSWQGRERDFWVSARVTNVDTVTGTNVLQFIMVSPTGAIKEMTAIPTLGPGQFWNYSWMVQYTASWPDGRPVIGRYELIVDVGTDRLVRYMDVISE